MIQFDHVYVERAVRDAPVTRDLLARLQPPRVTGIDDAQRMFKRPGQDFARQKRRPRLILARKRPPFLYAGTDRVASFGGERAVHYNDMVRNCLYDCDYCFLQGMHRSANILVNVNIEDYVAAVDDALAQDGSLYLSISYLSDLLGFERSLGLVRRWVEIARSRPGLEVEVRTKSDGYAAIQDIEPHDGIILTWSISPDEIARRHEAGTASSPQRLLDAGRAIARGWRVRLCIDPVIATDGWEDSYRSLVDRVFRRLDPTRVEAVSFGVFRMHPDFLDRITAFRRSAALDTGVERQGDVASYPEALRQEVFSVLQRHLARHMPVERIHAVHG